MLTFNRVVYPSLYQGLLERGLELSGAKGVTGVFHRLEGEQGRYDVAWV